MKDSRPVNLKLWTIRFPVTAIASVMHRASGVLLFLFIPCLLWLLWYSLSSPQAFNHMKDFMDYFILRFVTWVFMSALIYHLIAGVRHLLMDMGVGESLEGGRLGAWIVMLFSFLLIIGMGIYLLFDFNHAIW